MDEVECAVCHRKAPLGSGVGVTQQQKRWFLFPDGTIVCGGNLDGVTETRSCSQTEDLFPDGKGGLVRRAVEPHEIEVESDVCLHRHFDRTAREEGETVTLHLFLPEYEMELPRHRG